MVGYDQAAAVSDVATLEELVASLEPPRVVWLMVPAGDATTAVLADVAPLLQADDILIDGGNSNYRDSQTRARAVAAQGVRYLDVGTSGGSGGCGRGSA